MLHVFLVYVEWDRLSFLFVQIQVDNLKKELHNVSDEVRQQEEGINRLEKINNTLSTNGPYQVDKAREKVNEMKEMREQLLLSEQEKIRILQDLLQHRDEYQSHDLPLRYSQVCCHYFLLFLINKRSDATTLRDRNLVIPAKKAARIVIEKFLIL